MPPARGSVPARLGTAALDRYEQERRPVAVILVKVTDRLFGVVGRRNRWTALLRRRVSRAGTHLAPRLLGTRFGRRIGGYLGQYRIRYRFAVGHARTPTWAADRAVGLRLPPVRENHVPLRTLAWQLHTYGIQAARPDLPAWIEGPHHFPADWKGRLQAGQLYLIRPDGYVAASLPIQSGHVKDADLRDALAAYQLRT